jgi:hypothetical protein
MLLDVMRCDVRWIVVLRVLMDSHFNAFMDLIRVVFRHGGGPACPSSASGMNELGGMGQWPHVTRMPGHSNPTVEWE